VVVGRLDQAGMDQLCRSARESRRAASGAAKSPGGADLADRIVLNEDVASFGPVPAGELSSTRPRWIYLVGASASSLDQTYVPAARILPATRGSEGQPSVMPFDYAFAPTSMRSERSRCPKRIKRKKAAADFGDCHACSPVTAIFIVAIMQQLRLKQPAHRAEIGRQSAPLLIAISQRGWRR